MKNLWRFIIPAAMLMLTVVACENDVQEVQDLTKQFEPSVETIKQVRMLYSEEANVKVELNAPLLLRHKTDNPYLEFSEGVKVNFFDEDLKKTGSLTADYGVRYEKQGRTTVKDKVVWISSTEKKRLETEELFWDERSQLISSTKFVKVTTESESILGEGFEAKQDFSWYKIKKITGIVKVRPDEFMNN